MEKDALQALKLEISRGFRLVPYERVAFHRILGICRSENGMRVLLRELTQGAAVRESAVSVLKDFDSPEILPVFTTLLKRAEVTGRERLHILDYLERCGSAQQSGELIQFIESNRQKPEESAVVERAIHVASVLGSGSEETFAYLKALALNKEGGPRLRCCAIEGLSSFKDISFFENIIREGQEALTFSVYRALSMLSDRLTRGLEESRTEEDAIYTYAPELEDKLALDIRVLLGKMTSQFDSYSRRVKTAFLSAMISCNHREFLIYTMKSLTAADVQLVDLVLYMLLANVKKLRDPDKLFRNLLALAVGSQRENDIIVSIFESYFTGLKENRVNLIFKDKMFNYISVTLETYFETYRKEFMITEVAEKDFPESFRNIRKFVLEKFSPDLKRKITSFLKKDDRTDVQPLLAEISSSVPYIGDSEKEDMRSLLEILYDKDQKSRDNSSVRLEDINFEKRYLRHRIVRICEIIGRLGIAGSASLLVKIFNYVKKYPDREIFSTVTRCLSMLNYPYLLGELEVLLSTGDEGEQKRSVEYLSLFTDSRALNILLDFAKDRAEQGKEVLVSLLDNMLQRDLSGNMTANAVFKLVLEKNSHPEIRRLAILCIGRCGVESDLDFLNSLFSSVQSASEKEAIVQAIGNVVELNSAVNRRQASKYLAEYLKDPAIKVRIYASAILISLGNKEAIKLIRDMMVIKNKFFQRAILSVIGHQRSVEFAYFLISLLKEEYGISSDIMAILGLVPDAEMREIDHFVVNVFKKYIGGDVELGERRETAAVSQESFRWFRTTLLNVEFPDYAKNTAAMSSVEVMLLHGLFERMVIGAVTERDGVPCRVTGERISSHFVNPKMAAEAAMAIMEKVRFISEYRLSKLKLNLFVQIVTDEVKAAGDDILDLPEYTFINMRSLPAANRILIDEPTRPLLENSYYREPIPESLVVKFGAECRYSELISPVNTLALSQGLLAEMERQEREHVMAQMQREAELKRFKSEQKRAGSIEYAQAMDEIGRVMKSELGEIVKYVQRRSTDRDLINTVEKMAANVNKRYLFETTKIIMG